MKINKFNIGNEKNLVLEIYDILPDDFLQSHLPETHKFKKIFNFYPGYQFKAADNIGNIINEKLAPILQQEYSFKNFKSRGAFSVITNEKKDITPQTAFPHYDSLNNNLIVCLFYVSDTPNSGTSFYRFEPTKIEKVSETNNKLYNKYIEKNTIKRNNFVERDIPDFTEIHFCKHEKNKALIFYGANLHGVIYDKKDLNLNNLSEPRVTYNHYLHLNEK
jgi:hypothetical protein